MLILELSDRKKNVLCRNYEQIDDTNLNQKTLLLSLKPYSCLIIQRQTGWTTPKKQPKILYVGPKLINEFECYGSIKALYRAI